MKDDMAMIKDAMFIRGVAVKSGISRNSVMYEAKELEKFAETMIGVSILKDHENIVDNAIGVVTEAYYDSPQECVMYEGWIKEDGTDIISKIQDGRVKHVSVGAMAGKIVKETEESDYVIAKDLTCCELSVVVVPGIPEASIQQNSVNRKKENSVKVKEEKTVSVVTSEDLRDGHKHEAVFDQENGSGFTNISGGAYPHKHEVKDAMVVDFKDGEYVSQHPGKLQLEATKSEGEVNQEKSQSFVPQIKTKEENIKMTEQKLNELQDSLSRAEEQLHLKEERLKALEEQVRKELEEKRLALVEKYKKVAEEKKMQPKDVSKVSEEAIKLLIEQLEEVKVEEKATEMIEEKPKFKGEVIATAVSEESESVLAIERSDFGTGYSLFSESYDSTKFKRLMR